MSDKGGGGHNNGGGKGLSATIPPSSKKMVQSLKEIVSNFPDHEIYAMLKDCNMDPNEAVSRLLSQDPFHEVKSKREKKKETKEPTDSRSRGTNNTYSRGGSRTGTDRHGGRGGANQFSSSSNDFGLQGKPAHKKENGTAAYGGSATGVLGSNVNRRPPSHSDSVATGKTFAPSINDGLPSSSQHSGLQSAWTGNVGQLSMADIVKMGRPKANASVHNSSIHGSYHQNVSMPAAASDHNWHSLQGHASKVSETNADQGHNISHNVPQIDEWPCIENQHGVRVYAGFNTRANSEHHANSSSFTEANWPQETHLDEHEAEDASVENADHVESDSVSPNSASEDNMGAEDGVSSLAVNLDKLNLQRDDQGTEPEEDNPSVVIPNHLQLHTSECLNLSFGSFGPGNNAPLSGSGSYTPKPLNSNLEDTSRITDVSTIGTSDVRNPDYYEDDHLATASDGNFVHGTGVSARTYEHTSISRQEVVKPEPSETAQENQYSFPSASHGFTYENTQQTEVTFPHSQTSSQMQNLAPFSNAYTNPLPNALLASTAQTAREDIPYLPFPAAQGMPAKYNNIASPIGGSTITMSEALRSSSVSAPQPNAQTPPGASIATRPAPPQHLAVHPYSQPALPLGPYANMISYPFLPQSYTYMPSSAFQQTFAGNSSYQQSLAAMLPQYKSSASVSSLPQTAAIPSGFGFGSSTSIPGGNFSLNPPAAPTGTTIAYEDMINTQFKNNNHMISLQQNENSPMWAQGPGSRTMSAVPPSTYYGLQGQNQQPGGFRQRQQPPTQHFEPLGYSNYYQSQTGISLEHQQQNPREASLGGPQTQPSKQSQQLWQNSY